MPLFTREFVSCQAKSPESHLYNDPVMLVCSHVFCRSCCLYLAQMSKDQSISCPVCSTRIPFDDLDRFANNLISHGTLATMVQQYLRKETTNHICSSCQIHYINDMNGKLCKKCETQNENIKKEIKETMESCEELLAKRTVISVENIRQEANQLRQIVDQRAMDFVIKLDQYQGELQNLLIEQQKANEINSLKHQAIDINMVSALVEPRLTALRNNERFIENIEVEKEIKRLNDEADRQLRLLKHKADIVPVLCPLRSKPSTNMLGELLFKSIQFERKLSNQTVVDVRGDKSFQSDRKLSNQTMIGAHGDTSFQSIPPKLPMWTVILKALPSHLSVYPLGKSTLIFSCSSIGIISLLTYISPVTYDSPRYIRSFSLFDEQTRIFVQSFTIFNRFMLLHVYFHDKPSSINDHGSLYFFTHDGILEHEPIPLSNPIHQYLADESRLWAIDIIEQTIFSHPQPLFPHEISSILSKRENFISFNNQSNFIPFRLAINHQVIGILSKNLQQVFIYNKTSRERIFTSHFSAGDRLNIWDIRLFPRDNSLLLKFEWSYEGNVRHSLFIHFNTKNQSVGRIEGKHCLGVVIGPNKEILIGYNLRTGVIRCYM